MKKIRVCSSRSCAAFGSEGVMRAISEATGIVAGQQNEKYDVDWCGCRGWCSNSPNVEVNDSRIIFEADPATIMERIDQGGGTEMTGRELNIDDVLKQEDDFLK